MRGIRQIVTVLVCLGGWAWGTVVAADEVVVAGDRLRGTVTTITAAGVVLDTIYGAGALTIAWEDIEAIHTDESFVVLYGDRGEARGRLLGVRGADVLVGPVPETTVAVRHAAIRRTHRITAAAAPILESLRSRWRYWNGTFDLAFALTQATVDSRSLGVRFEVAREKAGTRVALLQRYRVASEKARDADRTTLEDELYLRLLGTRDLTDRLFLMAAVDAEYDSVERLSLRTVPTAGIGYRLRRTETVTLSVSSGPAWRFERFFGGDTTKVVSARLGAEAGLALPYGAHVGGTLEYLPAVDDWSRDYLVRSEAALTFPVRSWLALKGSVAEQFKSLPAANADRNELTTMLGLSLAF